MRPPPPEEVLALEDVAAIESGIANAEVRDPGLWPRFWHFHATTWGSPFAYVPGHLNRLVSEWTIQNKLGEHADGGVEHCKHARVTFLDSGTISPIARCMKGTATPDEVRAWLNHQPEMVERALSLYQRGSATGIVGTMDVPQYPAGLKAAGIATGEALEITMTNALEFKATLAAELPPGWKPAYMLQGPTQAAYLECLGVYEAAGIIADAQRGDAWLSVGGTLATAPPALYTIYRTIREAVGPEPHIHALGVSRQTELVYMARRGWINGSDSSSTAMSVTYNRGPYRTDGPRTTWFHGACFAAQAMLTDATLARAIAEADAQDIFEQEALVF